MKQAGGSVQPPGLLHFCCAYALAFALASILAFLARSNFDIQMAQVASPVMFSVVRPISKSLSTPAMMAMPSTGMPMDVKLFFTKA